MKLICERTTFIPGFCVFLLHRNTFSVSLVSTPRQLRYITRRYSE
jgi:hypothetical protein